MVSCLLTHGAGRLRRALETETTLLGIMKGYEIAKISAQAKQVHGLPAFRPGSCQPENERSVYVKAQVSCIKTMMQTSSMCVHGSLPRFKSNPHALLACAAQDSTDAQEFFFWHRTCRYRPVCNKPVKLAASIACSLEVTRSAGPEAGRVVAIMAFRDFEYDREYGMVPDLVKQFVVYLYRHIRSVAGR